MMMNRKITVQRLLELYLPFGIDVYMYKKTWKLVSKINDRDNEVDIAQAIRMKCLPILQRIENTHSTIHDLDTNGFDYDKLSYADAMVLMSNGVDIYNALDTGLAVDRAVLERCNYVYSFLLLDKWAVIPRLRDKTIDTLTNADFLTDFRRMIQDFDLVIYNDDDENCKILKSRY